jgi:hypothetical protein
VPTSRRWPALYGKGRRGFPERKREAASASLRVCGAGEESRTLDLNLGKVALYQLSYSRIDSGGAWRSRTALRGFAIRCITDLLTRRVR